MEKKISSLKMENSNKILEVYFEIQSLKNLFRQGWLQKGIDSKHCESVADHSFSATMLAWLIADEHLPELDIFKIIKYSLIHEIGEIYAGDITPGDDVSDSEKYKLESEAVKKVFSKLNNGEKYIKLWEEFEKGDSKEAAFVKQIDKLDMALQAHFYEKKLNLDLSSFKKSAAEILNSQVLKEILDQVD